ncbi:YggT family protein [Clostridium chrysemydis]|uniref:YggT family protein n=1 Tax=Clostridium chrysemydis TaxID=2665504 RepID=UPI001883FB2B|nr:YggT family protein [Clostridium chrysemydis]
MVSIINLIFRALEVIIIVECLLSWVPSSTTQSIRESLNVITGPILEPFRQLQYKFLGDLPIDLSPIFAIVVLNVVQSLIIRLILF